MTNNVDPDQFRSQLIWIYSFCKDMVYLGSAGQGLILNSDKPTDYLSGKNLSGIILFSLSIWPEMPEQTV